MSWGADTSPRAPLRTQAAFIAVTNLDARAGRRHGDLLPPGELPPGVAAGLSVTMPENGASYRLGFDGRFLLVWATGPFDVPYAGPRRAHRALRRLSPGARAVATLPHHYEIGPRRLAVEHALRVCPNTPELTAAAFVDPERLPACAP